MAEFSTPEPISVAIEIIVGDVRITADDRSDTVVDVRPSDPDRRDDVTAAEQARVEFEAGRLLVRTIRRWKSFSPFSDGGSVDVHISLPAGSDVSGELSVGAFRCTGTLGNCTVRTSMGRIHVDRAATARLRTGAGDITVEHADADVELSTGSGEVRAGWIGGAAVIKNSNGATHVGDADGDLRVKSANGDIAVARSRASLAAKTANGDIRLGAAMRGSVVAETGMGAVEIGVPDGTAAWLDLSTHYGQVLNDLDAADRPEPDEHTVEVRARSSFGDVIVRRCYPEAEGN